MMSNVVSILGYGAVGLGLLLAILAYRLLLSGTVNERPVYVFEGFCLTLVIIGAFLQYSSNSATAAQNQALQSDLQSTKESLTSEKAKSQSAELSLANAKSTIGGLAASTRTAFPDADKLAVSVGRISSLIAQSCGGGDHGNDPANAEEIRNIANDASQRIASAKSNIDNVTQRAQAGSN